MSNFRTLGVAEVGYGPNGELLVRKESLRAANRPSDFGADYGGGDDFGADDDFAAELTPSEAAYYGALSKDERQEYRNRKRKMRRGNRSERQNLREWRREQRHDDDDGGDDDAPKRSNKNVTPYIFNNTFSVSAAGAWQIQILPQCQAKLNDMFVTGPAGTYVSSITIGILPVLAGGAVDISVFASTSFIRDLVRNRTVTPSLPVTLAGTTTATSGVISAGITGFGPPPV